MTKLTSFLLLLGWFKQAGWQSTGQGLHSHDWAGNTEVKHW